MRRCALILVLACASSASAQTARRATATEPVAAILDAFKTHEIVTVSDPHGRMPMQAFLLALIRDPRFADTVNDIVVEPASSRYQDVVDRFVRGDDVREDVLRKAWEDAVVPSSPGVLTEELIRAVRVVNNGRNADKRLRVLLGDPPIDWDNVTSAAEHFKWVELRDTYPADLIRRQVLERGRKALVIYGQMHAQRKQSFSNYDMSTWQSQTIVSLLERDAAARVFNVWSLFEADRMPAEVDQWPIPALAVLRGTTLGAADFATLAFIPNRFGISGGRIGPVPRAEWRQLAMQEQFDAVLYLGPPASWTTPPPPSARCADSSYVAMRVRYCSTS